MPQEMEQMSLFDLDTPCGKTSPMRTVQTEEKISESSSKNSAGLPKTTFQFLDLRKDGGAALVPLWETDIQSLGVRWMRNFGEYPSAVEEYGLSQILEDEVPLKYYLSRRERQWFWKSCSDFGERPREQNNRLHRHFVG